MKESDEENQGKVIEIESPRGGATSQSSTSDSALRAERDEYLLWMMPLRTRLEFDYQIYKKGRRSEESLVPLRSLSLPKGPSIAG